MKATIVSVVRGLPIPVILFYLSSNLNAQITIKEKVEIKPKANATLQAQSSTGDVIPWFVQEVPNGPILVMAPCILQVNATVDIEPSDNSYCEIDIGVGGTPIGDIQQSNGITIYTANLTDCSYITVGATGSGGWLHWAITDLQQECGPLEADLTFKVNYNSGSYHREWNGSASVSVVGIDSAYILKDIEWLETNKIISSCEGSTCLEVRVVNISGGDLLFSPCLAPPPLEISIPSNCGDFLSNGCTGYVDPLHQTKLLLSPDHQVVELDMPPDRGQGLGTIPVMASFAGKNAIATVQFVDGSTNVNIAMNADDLYYGLKTTVIAQTVNCLGNAPLGNNAYYGFYAPNSQQYGYLRDPATGNTGIVLIPVNHVNGRAEVEFVAHGDSSGDNQEVTIYSWIIRDNNLWILGTMNLPIRPCDSRIVIDSIDSVPFAGDPDALSVRGGDKIWMHLEPKSQPGTRWSSDWETRWMGADTVPTGVLFNADSTMVGNDIRGSIPTACFVVGNQQSISDVWLHSIAYEPGEIVWGKIGNSKTDTSTGIKQIGSHSIQHGKNKVSPTGALQKIQEVIYIEHHGAMRLAVQRPCAVVCLSKKQINPGDTVTVTVMGKIGSDTIPFPAGQMFDIWMDTDERYGKLRSVSTGEVGSDIYGIQPFEFIAADSIDVDSVAMLLEAWVSDEIVDVAALSNTGTKGIPTGMMLKLQTDMQANPKSVLAGKVVVENNETGNAGSIRHTSIDRKKRSFAKLMKRLSAVREKAKNKTQIDKVIARVEARFLRASGGTSTKSLTKTGQSVMSTADEGESCEPPMATVTIKKEPQYHPCQDNPIVKIEPYYLDNHTGCLQTDEMVAGADTYTRFADVYQDGLVISVCFDNISKIAQLQMNVFQAQIVYGICLDNLQSQGINLIHNLGEVTQPEQLCNWKKELEARRDLLLDQNRASLVVPMQNAFEPELINHELKHVEQDKKYVQEAFQEIIKQEQSISIPPEEAKRISSDLAYAKYKAMFIQNKIELEYKQKKNIGDRPRKDEVAAQDIQRQTLNMVLEDIKNKGINCN